MPPSRTLLAPFFAGFLLAAPASAATLPDGFEESVVFSGLLNPTAARFAPNGQVFVAEKSGRVLVYDGVGDATPTQVVDLNALVYNFWDRGLLGLAVDPAFPTRPYLYALYTHDALPNGTSPAWGTPGVPSDPCPDPTGDGCVVMGRLSRIDVNPITMQGSEVMLLQGNWCQQYPSHSTGDLVFGADGMLYASAGDGASFTFTDWGQDGNPVNPCGDPTNAGGALRSQDILTTGDPTSFDGSVLRLDVSNVGAGVQTPLDNPLRNNGVSGDDLIIAHGLRNPFRITHRPGTDEIWITDVGWNQWEEVDRIADPNDAVVENFGWPCYEGGNATSTRQGGYDAANLPLCESLYTTPARAIGSGGATSVLTPSVYAYDHGQQVVPGELCGTGSSSATGAAFYQGGDYPPEYDGAFFFADSSRRCVWTMFAGAGGAPNPAARAPLVSVSSGRVVDIQIGPGGDLFYVDFDGGNVFRVEFFPVNTPPTAAIQASPTSGPAPLFVSFDGSASTDPEDGSNLAYAWDLDGDGAFDDSTSATPSHTFAAAGDHLVRLRVTDTIGASDTASVTITADNTPPVVQVTAPSPSLLWAVGDPIHFEGGALDAQDGWLPASSLSWTLLIHHCDTLIDCHTHTVQDFPGVASGTFAAPDHDYPSHLELRLTATDLGVGAWWNPAWTRRQRLQFDNSAQSEDLNGFPVLVLLDPTRIDYGLVADGGADLRFVDSDGTPLPHEIDTWNEAGVSAVWVRVPRIDGGSTQDHMWLYFGNAAAPDAQDPHAVWAGYAGVWHLGSSLADSSASANHGANAGTSLAAGHIGAARRFNGASWIDAGSAASLRITGQLGLEAWIAIDDPAQPGSPRVLSKKPVWEAGEGYNLEYHPAENNLTTVGSGSDYARADLIDLDTSWHWVGASVNGGTGRMFVDGDDRTTDASLTPLVAGAQSLRFGREQAEFFRGRIDEIRIAPVARSADWMAAQFLSMSDAFVTFSASEGRAALSASASVLVFPATVTLDFRTYPAGLVLGVGDGVDTTPFSRTVIVGSTQSLSAPSPQILGGNTYGFQLWSDGGAQNHNATAPPVRSTFRAFYVLPQCNDGLDNDGDGDIDYPADPGCSPFGLTERTRCDDDVDNDMDGRIDWDGGPQGGTADPECGGNPHGSSENPGCGLGFELTLVVPLLRALRRRRSRAS